MGNGTKGHRWKTIWRIAHLSLLIGGSEADIVIIADACGRATFIYYGYPEIGQVLKPIFAERPELRGDIKYLGFNGLRVDLNLYQVQELLRAQSNLTEIVR